jgi:hypothetical protein
MPVHLSAEQRQPALRLRARGLSLREIGPPVGCSHELVRIIARQAPRRPVSTAFVSHISWTSTSPVPGVTLSSGTYTDPLVHPYWTITIQTPTTSPFNGTSEEAEAGGLEWARSTEAALVADGFSPSAAELPWPAYTDDPRGVMGVRVRVGQFATEATAETVASELTADGFAPLVEWSGFDPTPAPDAELVRVAIIDPRKFDGRVFAYHGSAIASRTTAQAASAALGSVVATNGGFFTIDAPMAGGSTQFASYGQVLDDPSSSPLRPVGDTIEVVPST